MHKLNINGSNESPEHRSGKASLGDVFRLCGYDAVLFENKHCDVVAIRRTSHGNEIVGGEFERSSRNVVRNIHRNYANGCQRFLIVASNWSVAKAIRRKLTTQVPQRFLKQTILTTADRLTVANIKHLLRASEVYSVFIQG